MLPTLPTASLRRLTPRRLASVVTGVLALISVARVGVLFFESWAAVAQGRAEDRELMQLCQRGDARGSAKMREACLRARTDLASPVVFKALVHAVGTAFKDFSDAVGSPFKLFIVVLFLLSSIIMPLLPWARLFLGAPAAPMHYGSGSYIAFAPPPYAQQPRRGRFGRALRALKLRRTASVQDDDDDRFQELESCDKEFACVDIDMSMGRPASPVQHAKYD